MVHVDNQLLFFSKGMRLLVEWVEIEIILCEVIKIQKKHVGMTVYVLSHV